jgi:AcrR family transcriptional regulator
MNGDCHNKRQQILDAAYQVFSSKGYHRATVDEIIALADTGKGTVYNYFVNKEQLFYTVIQEKSTPFQAALQRIVSSQEQPLKKFRNMVKVFLEFYVQHGDLWRVMMHEIRGFGVGGCSNFSKEQIEKYHEWFDQTIGMFEKVIVEGKEQNVIRPECDALKAAHGIVSVIITFVFKKYVGDDLTDTTNRIADFALFGVAQQ